MGLHIWGFLIWGQHWKLWEGMSWPWKRVESEKKSCPGRGLKRPVEVKEDPQGNWKGGQRGGHKPGECGVCGGECWKAGGEAARLGAEGSVMALGRAVRSRSSCQTPGQALNPGSWPWGGRGREREGAERGGTVWENCNWLHLADLSGWLCWNQNATELLTSFFLQNCL